MTKSKWIDHYAELELIDPVSRTGRGPDASPDEIKKKRNELVKRFHPDHYRPGTNAWKQANDRCKHINRTYAVLHNPKSKMEYDREWLKRNSWFRQTGEGFSSEIPLSYSTLYTRLDWE
jgi:DnaJ-class molecular chaperone